jgi:RHS repeat-associated protein
MTSAGSGTATTTFAYDFQNQRVKKTQGSTNSFYPNKYVSKVGATTTDYVYMGDTIIAEVESGSGSGAGGGGSTSTSTPALVQSTVAHGATSVSFSSAVTTGDLVVVSITVFSQTLASNDITDNKGNTYTKAAEAINGTDHAAIYYAKNVTGSSTFQISSVDDGTIAIHEYSGVATSTALDATSTSTGTSNAPTSGNVTGKVGNELYFGVAWSNTSGDTWTAGSGYTLRQQETDNNTWERLATEDATTSAASTTAARFKVTTSDLWADAIAAFKPMVTTTGGGGGGGGSSATTTRYFHEDNLNSTNVMTDYRGNLVETLDYYPYGSTRIDQTSNNFRENKQFVGQYSDAETNLSYLRARYYRNTNGQFLSEDPVFLGDPKQQALTDPQSLNGYSYGNDNPITKSDPRGLWAISYNLASVGAEGGFGLFAGGSAGLSLSFVSGRDGGLALTLSSAGTGGYLQNSTSYPATPTGNPSFIYGAFASGGCALQALCGRAVQYSGSFSHQQRYRRR